MVQEVYALKNTKKILDISSSGGAFLAIAKSLFEKYGDRLYVFGVCFGEDMQPQYKIANTLEKCQGFCGSKYVYCNVFKVLKQINQVLIEGKYVLFVGTPCNVKIVLDNIENAYLRNNLYTVDLICNGTPSLSFWNEYVKWLENQAGSKLIDFKFRCKGDVYNPYLTEARFIDGRIFRDMNKTACYNQAFLKKLTIKKGCFNCSFKRMSRVSDITIGDFWGISKVLPDFSDDKEVSEIIVNTVKGKSVISSIELPIKLMRCLNKEYINYQPNLIKKTIIPDDYENFWCIYNTSGISKALAKYTDAGTFGNIVYFFRKHLRFIRSKK